MDSRSGSITPNSMMVLERGAGGVSTLVGPAAASRPPSGRRSRARTPVQRSGSQLEVLPPTGDEKVTASGKPSSRPSSRSDSTGDSGRQTHSAGSSRGQRSGKGQTGQTPHEGLSRAESLDSGISPREGSSSRPGSAIHKQVSLTTVKRNYEMNGAPKNESYDFVPKDVSDIASTSLTNGTIPSTRLARTSTGASGGAISNKRVAGVAGAAENGGNGDGVNIVSEQEVAEQRLDYLMDQLSTKNDEIRRHEERRGSLDATKNKDYLDKKRQPSAALTDPYYVSTGSLPTTQAGASDEAEKAPPFLEEKEEGEDEDDSGDEEDDDEEEEGPKAPIELMSEFLDAVMEEEFETADKLCKMILIYEPENPECLQFKPLIEEMLKREWHHQLWGSGSEGESGDDDDEDGEENEDDDDEDDDEDDDDSDEDSSESDSSEESDDDDEEEEKGGKKESSSSVLFQHGQET